MSKPLQKQLWKQIICQKILNQADHVRYRLQQEQENDLHALIRRVKSGDADNIEALAARRYFINIFGKSFKRDHNTPVNAALNYGYALVRGIIAKNIAAAGFMPSLGIAHHSQLNEFNLADDLLEPFRPIVDYLVVQEDVTALEELTPDVKNKLIDGLNSRVHVDGSSYRLSNAAEMCVKSFVSSVEQNDSSILQLPQFELP